MARVFKGGIEKATVKRGDKKAAVCVGKRIRQEKQGRSPDARAFQARRGMTGMEAQRREICWNQG